MTLPEPCAGTNSSCTAAVQNELLLLSLPPLLDVAAGHKFVFTQCLKEGGGDTVTLKY